MRISTEQLARHLAQDLKPLYTVFGEEMLLALEAADRIRARARALGYTEREVLTADTGFRWSDLAFVGRSQSLFSSLRVIELRIPTGRPGTEGAGVLARHAGDLPPDTVTLITLPGIDWRAQKAGWFEALERSGVVIEARPVTRRALPAWLAGRLREQEQDADPETLEFLAERVEGNLLAAHQEVQKLALLFPPGRVSIEAMRHAVADVARFDVFQLGEALLAGDVRHIVRMLDGLRSGGAAPPLVLWAIVEEARAIARVLDAGAAGVAPPQLWREARVWGTAHQQLMQAHRQRFNRAAIDATIVHAARVDRMAKGLVRGDVWDELLRLALRFAPMAGAGAMPGRGTMAARASARNQNALF